MKEKSKSKNQNDQMFNDRSHVHGTGKKLSGTIFIGLKAATVKLGNISAVLFIPFSGK